MVEDSNRSVWQRLLWLPCLPLRARRGGEGGGAELLCDSRPSKASVWSILQYNAAEKLFYLGSAQQKGDQQQDG